MLLVASSKSSTLAFSPSPRVDIDQRPHHNPWQRLPSSRAIFKFRGARASCNPALSSASGFIDILTATLVPSWIGFRVLKDVRGSNSSLNPIDFRLPAAVPEMTGTSGLTFLVEDWVGRAAVAGCLVLSVFALPVGMAIFR
ncbi:hypothetical protein GSI_11105 [Ganoderma sinense ZZ0214-1]|uniref:Uncharacterized protein n=1 Tax=Ganoderma sinense ZZ0214-1 TaxID=1077348 RepID=A0A2G8RZ18_9APHY|nr:hypothetical protein GSI_11105 [Ganoderma sinense ZZ0214-1]